MSLGKCFLVVGVGALALLSRLVVADDAPPVPKETVAAAVKDAKPVAAGETVEQLIEQLDSADFDTRDKASGKLAAKGKDAVPALEKAAANGDLEVSSAATNVLGKLLDSADEATTKAADEALQRLSDGDRPAAARKAKSILTKKNAANNNLPGVAIPGNGFGGQIIINGGQLNIGGGGVAVRTLSVKNANGVKEINAVDNDKTVKIVDDPAQGIKVELTEKQNGKEVTKKYEAKNVEELKKLPAGYDLYKKYVGEQAGNGIVVRAGGGILLPGNTVPAPPPQPANPVQPANPPQAIPPVPQPQPAIPAPAAPAAPILRRQTRPMIPAPAVVPAAATPPGNVQIDSATRLVKNLSTRIERLQQTEAYKTATPESKAELKKEIDELSKQMEAIRGQLGDK
jgi:hypothetical protein